MQKLLITSVLAGGALMASFAGVAAQNAPNVDEIAKIHLIGGWKMDNGHIMGALQVTMAPGWKTYWRAAGETGVPPRFDWQGSENLGAVAFHWPRPDLITVGGVTVIGYKNELVLPIEFTPKTAGQKIEARANLEIGICKDVCMPVTKPLSVSLDANADNRDFLIEMALADQPLSPAVAGMGASTCTVEKIEDGYRVSGRFSLPAKGDKNELVVFESPMPDIWITASKTRREGGVLFADADMISLSGKDFDPNPGNLRVTLIGKERAVDVAGCAPGS